LQQYLQGDKKMSSAAVSKQQACIVNRFVKAGKQCGKVCVVTVKRWRKSCKHKELGRQQYRAALPTHAQQLVSAVVTVLHIQHDQRSTLHAKLL
jgi:hypothetical protein